MTPAIRSRSCPAFILAAMAALCVGCGGSSGRASTPPPSPPPAAVPASATSHIVVLVMENKEDKDVLAGSGSPYIKSLARRYARPVNSFGITHPSLPNYLALTSGSTQGITSDCTDCRVRATNLVDQLETRRLSWKAYVEDLARRPQAASTPRSTTRSCTTRMSRATRPAAATSCRSRGCRATCAAAGCRRSRSSRPTCATTRTTAGWTPAIGS
jgi:hypothetical protein